MVGVLVVTHGNLGLEMIQAAELIRGGLQGVLPISVDQRKGMEELKKEISSALKKVDTGKGVLILTDLFGGTPSNLSLSFLKPGRVEVVTGVNLPMLLKLCELQEEMTLDALSDRVANYGKKNIYLASEVLRKRTGA